MVSNGSVPIHNLTTRSRTVDMCKEYILQNIPILAIQRRHRRNTPLGRLWHLEKICCTSGADSSGLLPFPVVHPVSRSAVLEICHPGSRRLPFKSWESTAYWRSLREIQVSLKTHTNLTRMRFWGGLFEKPLIRSKVKIGARKIGKVP